MAQAGHDFKRSELSDDDFAANWTDAKGKTWHKLIIKDAKHTRLAVDMFNDTDMPDDVKPKAKARLLAACKKFGIKAPSLE